MSFKPDSDFVYLEQNGNARIIPGGETFWSLPESEMEKFGRGWLITEFECTEDWANWEMHPLAEEFVYVLSGDIEFHLERPEGTEVTRIVGRGAVVVPRGMWHTAKVSQPSRMLFVTMGAETKHRAAGGA